LAFAIARLGKNVLALDADLGLANLDVIFGVRPSFTLYHAVKGKKDLVDCLLSAGPGVRFVAGGSGIQELADMDEAMRISLIENLGKLESYADVLLLDTGAGLSSNVTSFVLAADEVLLVTTPEPTAMADAYGVLKTMAARAEKGPLPDIRLVINRVRDPKEGSMVATRIRKVAREFLDLEVGYLGYVLEDKVVTRSVRSQKPFMRAYPNSLAAACVSNLAANLFELPVQTTRPEAGTFFDRLQGYLGVGGGAG
jgi:flagellar biosynthesis protein FlhG